MVTVEDALKYTGHDIEYIDDVIRGNAQRALKTANKVLLGAVGEDLEDLIPGDARADELVLIYFDDLFSERGVSAKVSGATRRLVADMELQLRLELRAKREAGAQA